MKESVWNPRPAVELKSEIRAEIEREIAEFLAKGGQITQLNISDCAEPVPYGRMMGIDGTE